jgi:hypothetical protein
MDFLSRKRREAPAETIGKLMGHRFEVVMKPVALKKFGFVVNLVDPSVVDEQAALDTIRRVSGFKEVAIEFASRPATQARYASARLTTVLNDSGVVTHVFIG